MRLPPPSKEIIDLEGVLLLMQKARESCLTVFANDGSFQLRRVRHLKSEDLIPPAKIPKIKTRNLELVYFEVTLLPEGWFILS